MIPLCATIHLSGSTLKIVACALALMMMQGIPFDFPCLPDLSSCWASQW
ncbi:dicarboxylate/amino acid:cation symporter [Parabacteroides johnsonii]|nr:dicarboxylate/amino acid:cation symporter [Parabacteroides johnsonii]